MRGENVEREGFMSSQWISINPFIQDGQVWYGVLRNTGGSGCLTSVRIDIFLREVRRLRWQKELPSAVR